MKTKLVFIGHNPKNVSKYSSKFWFASVEGNALSISFGAIGSKGVTLPTRFLGSDSLAREEYRTLVQKKLAEGYERLTR